MSISDVSAWRILAGWYSMYADWDEGKACSPSATDLVRHYVDVTGDNSFDVDKAAEVVFDRAEDGLTLEEQLNALTDFAAPAAPTIESFPAPTEPLLFARIVGRFPTAEPNWAGAEDLDSAVVTVGGAVDGGTIVTTSWNEIGTYDIGVYVGDAWMESGEPTAMLAAKGRDAAVDLVSTLADPPEGVDWAAWVVQWVSDASADGRICGEVCR